MKHYLVTRFNLTVDDWKVDRNNSSVLTEEWLDDRFLLFHKFCLPSVQNQSCQDFKWFVYFDTQTPDHYKKLVLKLATEYNNFTPYFINGATNLNENICKNILEDVSEDEYILTTRIDNDDAIHKNFVETIQKLSDNTHGLIIDIRKGYQIRTGNFIEIRESIQPFNPFISIVQKRNELMSIYINAHTKWNREENIVIHSEQPLWIQFIHGRNKINAINHHNKLQSTITFENFGIKSMRTHSIFYIRFYNFLFDIYKIILFVK